MPAEGIDSVPHLDSLCARDCLRDSCDCTCQGTYGCH